MSIYSTRYVTPDEARTIIRDHLKEVRKRAKSETLSPAVLDQILNDYVTGNGEYWTTNFVVQVDRTAGHTCRPEGPVGNALSFSCTVCGTLYVRQQGGEAAGAWFRGVGQ